MNSFLLSVQATTAGTALTWPEVPGAAGYEVHRREGSAAFTLLGSPGEAAYLDTEVVGGIEYTYQVEAVHADGSRARSWPASVAAEPAPSSLLPRSTIS